MTLKSITKGIPNTITCCNLLSGGVSVALSFSGEFQYAFIMILIAAVFDFLDGLSARALGAYSAIGKELDSLADMVSFGVAPAVMLMCKFSLLLRESNGIMPSNGVESGGIIIFGFGVITFWSLTPLLVAAFSALRLAKFNIDERQSENFIGLATPACAMILGSMICMMEKYPEFNGFFLSHCLLIPAVVIVLSWLLVSEIPMFSFKFKSLSWSNNSHRFIFLLFIIAAAVFVMAASLHWSVLVFSVMVAYLAINLGMGAKDIFGKRKVK